MNLNSLAERDPKLARLGDGGLALQTAANDNVWLHQQLQERTGRLEAEIAQRQRIEEGLRANWATWEERFREVTETIREVFWLVTPDQSEVIYVSPAYEELWGRSCQSAYDDPLSWAESVHSEDRPRVLDALSAKLARGDYDEEFRLNRPDGSLRWVRARGFPVRNARGEVYRVSGIWEDVTRRRELEQQLVQSQKMEAFGRLAGGVAHDFNNLLTVIVGYTEILLAQWPGPENGRLFLEEVRKAGERAAALTRQLLAFSRKQVLDPVVLDVNDVLERVHKLLGRLIGEDVELITLLHAELPAIKADPAQIEQVLMNLAVNAREAMPEGGKLIVQTDVAHVDGHAQGCAHLPPGRYVALTVSDTGCGMDERVRMQVFEPFFTTKPQGTGLGLATAYGIVRQSGGDISVSSEPGKGTTFRILLPAVPESECDRRPGSCRFFPLPGTETILLVEDQDEVRAFARETLRGSGYLVLEASNGVEALSVARDHPGPIDLLVTDVVMPQMGGRQLADQLVVHRPALRVLFVSGYTDDAVLRHGVQSAHVAFLQKPFNPSALVRKVRDVLDQSDSPARSRVEERSPTLLAE